MTPEHTKQLEVYTKKVDNCMSDLKTHIDDNDSNVKNMALDVTILKTVVFGNKELGEKGMKEKVDDMHEILMGFRGMKSILGVVILIGLAIATIKGFFIK
jgi:hypothetical protein